jgi:hypothetical protein
MPGGLGPELSSTAPVETLPMAGEVKEEELLLVVRSGTMTTMSPSE